MKTLLHPLFLLLTLMAVPLAANSQVHADVNGDDCGDDDWGSYISTPKTNGINSLIKSLMMKKTIKSRK